MRKQLLSLMVPFLAFAFMASAADMTGKGAPARAQLERLEVAPSPNGLLVQFKAIGTLSPHVATLDSPARIVVDLPNTALASAQTHIAVGHDGVKDVRIGVDGLGTTRVVFDLSSACRHEIVTGLGAGFALRIQEQVPQSARKTAAPKSPAATASVAAPSGVAPTTATTAPTEVAFVEPKFSVKPAAPADKAQEAASRFADKTAAELVSITSNAAMQDGAKADAPKQPAVNMAAEQKEQMAQRPAASNGAKYTGEPISVNLKDVDLKDFFRLIHEISGLNVVLDPQIRGTLTIVLDDVPWDQALDIVLKNNDLSRQLDGNVLRIANVDTLKHEAESRRAQVDAEALAVDKITITRFLSYAHSKDVLVTVRKFLSQRGDIVADERTNSLIISDIPATLPQIDRIIQQMDRKTQEVEIEARVVAATRSFARDIGTQFGFGWGNGPTAVGGVGAVGGSPILTGPFVNNPLYQVTGSPSSGTSIPLFSNLPATGPTSGLSFQNVSNNVRIDFLLTMAESRGLLKILSRPRIVTQNNIQAIVKQGVRLPIESSATALSPATVTYVDAMLRLTVTPQITSEGTIFLNVDVENTVPDFGEGDQLHNPALITQQATTQVLVTDGGTVVIGGVIQTNNSMQVSQVPVLGNIPYLGNLFKHRSVSTNTQELIFFITPRIVQT